jgi:hypothetical protein
MKLASQKTHQNQWRTNEQWARLVWSYYQDILSPDFNNEDLDGKCIDAALRKNKLITANLTNYTVGTNATGIMCRFYSPWTLLMERKPKHEFIVTFASNLLRLSYHHLMERNGLTLFHLLKPVKAID